MFLDPLAGAVTKTHTTLETEKEEKPFDAPLSITKREQLERQVCRPSCTTSVNFLFKFALHLGKFFSSSTSYPLHFNINIITTCFSYCLKRPICPALSIWREHQSFWNSVHRLSRLRIWFHPEKMNDNKIENSCCIHSSETVMQDRCILFFCKDIQISQRH